MGVSYEQVARAAAELKGAGKRPSVRAVFSLVGGDYGVVQQHLKIYRQQEVPESAANAAELTATVLAALRAEVAHQRREAVLASSAELQEAREEGEDLMRENGRLGSALEMANGQLRTAEMDRERLASEGVQLRSQVEKAQERLEEERAASERARVDLAQSRLAASGNAAVVETLRADSVARRSEVEAERVSRLACERSLAVANVALEAQQGRLADLLARVEALENERAALQAHLEVERAQRFTAEKVRDIAQERTLAAVARAEDLAERERELRARI